MIRTEGLCKNFDDFVAVKNVDLHVRTGEILALLGPNGAGKTTTVRMLASILKPTCGRAWIGGHDVVEEDILVRRLVGVLTELPFIRITTLKLKKKRCVNGQSRPNSLKEEMKYQAKLVAALSVRWIAVSRHPGGIVYPSTIATFMIWEAAVLPSAVVTNCTRMIKNTIPSRSHFLN